MKGDWRVGRTSDGDEKEDVGIGTSRYVDQYGQSDVDVSKLRSMEEDWRTRRINNKDEFKSIKIRTFRYVNQYS